MIIPWVGVGWLAFGVGIFSFDRLSLAIHGPFSFLFSLY